MDLMSEIANARSVRSFRAEAIPPDVLTSVLDAGRRAPSAKNRQSWRFLAITDPQTRAAVGSAAYNQEWVANAAAQIAVCTTNVDYRMPNGVESWPVDLGIATGWMVLQARHVGLGSCIITTFLEAELRSLLSVPHSMRIATLIALGYPADSGSGEDRLPMARVVGWNHW